MMAEGVEGGAAGMSLTGKKQSSRIKARHMAALSVKIPTRICLGFNPYLLSKKLDNLGIKLWVWVRKVPVSNRFQFPEMFLVFPALLNAFITFIFSYTFYS